jgi:FKBP-type peptidyl-prolyl cis-trans isomerase
MPRAKQSKSAPSLEDPASAALSAAIKENSQGKVSAKPASKKKSASKKKTAAQKDPTSSDPDDPGAKAARAKKKASAKKAAAKKKTASKKKAAAQSGSADKGQAKPAKYGRAEALIDALKMGGDRGTIAELADTYYVKYGGGTPSVKGARAQLDVTLTTLKAAGVVVEDENRTLTMVK